MDVTVKMESPVGRLALNDDGEITFVNSTLAEWLDYDPAELTGQRIDLLLHGGAQFYLQSQLLPILRLQGKLEEVYLTLREKSGRFMPVLINAVHSSEDDVTTNHFVVMRIRKRAQLEDELLQAKKLAEQADEAKAKFLAMMSHELRTPLQTISLTNDALLDHGGLSDEQKALVHASASATASLVELIDDILNYAQMQAGRVHLALECFPISQALTRAETLMEHRLEQSGMIYERRNAAEPLLIRSDPRRLQQILLNLLNNALKFTPRGGTIRLSTRRSGAFAVVDVSDTGCGIPRDQVERVLEPFVQLPSAVGSNQKAGIGLGLAICRDLAKAMHGRLEVRSAVGVGSTFSVFLPLAEEPRSGN